MTSSTRIRFAALAATATVVAAGFFAAAPANAATGTITLANTSFTAGNWGSGLDVTGAGFTAGSNVTITVNDSVAGVLDTHVVTTPVNSGGAFADTFTPATALPELVAGETITVSATSDQGDDSNSVALTVASALAPKGIVASATTITTADLADKTVGFDVVAGGYTPGETVTVTAVYNGKALTSKLTVTAAADGSVTLDHLYIVGLVESGTLAITVTGSTSGLTQTVSIDVVGETVTTGTGQGNSPAIDGTPATARSASTPGTKLPVVSG